MFYKYSPYFSSFLHTAYSIPQKWINDIKHVEFNELLASSAGALALIFRWKKAEKNEFGEICYMSCALLKSKQTIFHHIEAQFGKYSFEVLLRYFLVF